MATLVHQTLVENVSDVPSPNIYLCKYFRFRFSYGDPFGMTSFCILNQSETSLDVIELSGGTPSSGA